MMEREIVYIVLKLNMHVCNFNIVLELLCSRNSGLVAILFLISFERTYFEIPAHVTFYVNKKYFYINN